MKLQESLRNLPGIDKVLEEILREKDFEELPGDLLADAARGAVAQARASLRSGKGVDTSVEGIAKASMNEVKCLLRPKLRPVINATGVVLHTNLGRAPLSETALELVNAAARGYSNLEFDLEKGERGSRYSLVVEKICRLTGAEDAIIVNNNAAAVLLLLAALGKEREVVVSRGELVEIGGSFRIPAVMEQSGAKLVEVGTTNKTHLRDYEAAINSETALLLKVHTSNYRIIGFTSAPDDHELVELGRRHKIAVVEDLGGGALVPISLKNWREPTIAEKLAAGFDLVTCSGDKLLGAGQAGIIAGRREYIEKLKRHQLLRALRIDKLSLAALEGTLCDYLSGRLEKIPVQRMLSETAGTLAEKQERFFALLAPLGEKGWLVEKCELNSMAGGGTLPEVDFLSFGVLLQPACGKVAALERHLRLWRQPIVVRTQDGSILLDVRSLLPGEMEVIAEACLSWEGEA